MNDIPEIGANIRRIRKERRLMQLEFAQAIGVSDIMLWRYETGNTIPPIPRLFVIARHLGVSVDDLFVGVDRPVPVVPPPEVPVDYTMRFSVPDGLGVFGARDGTG